MPTDDVNPPPRADSSGGLGLSGLSMNQIAPQATTEASEVAQRTSKRWLWIVLVLAVVGVAAFLLRATLNLPPNDRVQRQFAASPSVAGAVQQGIVRQVTWLAGDKLRVDFSPNLSLAGDADRNQLRRLTQSILTSMIELLPGRNLYIVGFQGDHQMLASRYLSRSTIIDRTGGGVQDIITNIEGDTHGGPSNGVENSMPKG